MELTGQVEDHLRRQALEDVVLASIALQVGHSRDPKAYLKQLREAAMGIQAARQEFDTAIDEQQAAYLSKFIENYLNQIQSGGSE
jgi:hypothetical protein